jgi:hypothetical protein
MPEAIASAMSTLYVPAKERSLTDKVMLDAEEEAALINRVILCELPEQKLTGISTFYPPYHSAVMPGYSLAAADFR